MVLVDIRGLKVTDELFLSKLKENGVLALTNAKNKVRMVTHRGIEKEHIERAITAMENVVEELSGGLA
jgi:acetylornithine/succinyldiaminopimelate/putrescine aminotransferase